MRSEEAEAFSPCEHVAGAVIRGSSSDGLINPIKAIVSSLWLTEWRRGDNGGTCSVPDVCVSKVV